jgi:N-acetylneuraminate synthase
MASLVVETERAWAGMGHVQYGATEAEQKSLQYRRSLYVVRDIAEGEAFSADNIRAIRPGLGLAPKHLDAVLGRKARHALKRGTALSWGVVG